MSLISTSLSELINSKYKIDIDNKKALWVKELCAAYPINERVVDMKLYGINYVIEKKDFIRHCYFLDTCIFMHLENNFIPDEEMKQSYLKSLNNSEFKLPKL